MIIHPRRGSEHASPKEVYQSTGVTLNARRALTFFLHIIRKRANLSTSPGGCLDVILRNTSRESPKRGLSNDLAAVLTYH